MKPLSYTQALIESMVEGLIRNKLSKGYRRLRNGLFEDILGEVYTLELVQRQALIKNDVEKMDVVLLKFKPVHMISCRGHYD